MHTHNHTYRTERGGADDLIFTSGVCVATGGGGAQRNSPDILSHYGIDVCVCVWYESLCCLPLILALPDRERC